MTNREKPIRKGGEKRAKRYEILATLTLHNVGGHDFSKYAKRKMLAQWLRRQAYALVGFKGDGGQYAKRFMARLYWPEEK